MKKRKNIKKIAVNNDHMIESISYEEIEVLDPNTGQKIKQRVKVIRYKARPPLSNSALDVLKELDETQTMGGEIDEQEQ